MLVFESEFDLASATVAAAAVCRRPAAWVTIDLRPARRIDDVALAALMRGAVGYERVVLGLSRHHERLLRYLAEDAATGEPRLRAEAARSQIDTTT